MANYSSIRTTLLTVFILIASFLQAQKTDDKSLVSEAYIHVRDTVVLRLNQYKGEYFMWQRSSNLQDWQDIPGSNADSLVFIAEKNTYFRAFVIAGNCNPFVSNTIFVSVYSLAEVETVQPHDITATTAITGGNIIHNGDNAVLAKGVVYSTAENPTLENNTGSTHEGEGEGTFTSHLTQLEPGTKYFVRAYATNTDGTAYGLQKEFTTGILAPTLTTMPINDIGDTYATSGGIISHNGGSAISKKGVVWDIHENPDIEHNSGSTDNGSGSSDFTAQITGLERTTVYYVKAYAENLAGIAYGNQQQFSTIDYALVETADITLITAHTATGGGNVVEDGGSAVTVKGVVWSINQQPDLSNYDGYTQDGSGLGSFSSSITALEPGTTYYAKAYATNELGTAYGTEKQFTTEIATPTVATSSISNITTTSASGGGNVSHDGGAEVIAHGLVWGITNNPDLDNNTDFSIDGAGTGSFITEITALENGTTYYVRAYATNEVGTSYGSTIGFTTFGEFDDVINPSTGKVWMDRNLDASRAANSSTDAQAYGDLYQWGRAADGHQIRTSGTTTTLSSSNTPGHGNFILAPNSPYDWRSPQNNNLWQGVNGTNNPCPAGYRLPTSAEWDAERLSWSSNNAAGAFASPLKLPVAGLRYGGAGSFYNVGSIGSYWSSAVDGAESRYLYFSSSDAYMHSNDRAYGFSVRCIKDGTTHTPNNTININSNPLNGGVVTGAGNYDEGTEINITATANEGYEFVNWSGDTNYIADANAPNTTVTMPAYDISITANFDESTSVDGHPCPGIPTVSDIDGNVYNTVFIGDQCWIKENLRVTKYSNGDEIPTELSSNEWENTTEGAYEIYPHTEIDGLDSNLQVLDAYGLLYNGHAISDSRGLCPAGWVIPSINDFQELINYAGDNQEGVQSLKSCRQPNSPLGGDCVTNTHPFWMELLGHYGSDNLGFSALPGGIYNLNIINGPDSQYKLGYSGFWWSSNGMGLAISHYFDATNYFLNNGLSVRCIKDDDVDPTTSKTITLNVSPEGCGEVTGAGKYETGVEININATANEGYEFVNWTGDTDYIADATAENTTLTMPAYDISLTANFMQIDIINGDGVTDIDGNEYTTVIIGNQEWMADNLRVTKYKNGDTIPTGLSDNDWGNTTEGAYSIYPFEYIDGLDSELEVIDAYGKLYNWYAADDERGLCPTGWRVPSNAEWIELVDFVVEQGYPNEENNSNGAGNALKSCRQLDSPEGGACETSFHPRWNSHSTHYGTDEFGFSALPGGNRHSTGNFAFVGRHSTWWSSSEDSSQFAWMWLMQDYRGDKRHGISSKEIGCSMRCIKDKDGPKQILTIIISPSGAGMTIGAGDYEEGAEINITATANAGYEFVNWSGDTDYIADANAPNTTVTMPAYDISLTANFAEVDNGNVVTDIDGNIYYFIEIDSVMWMRSNLRTTKYQNGEDIISNLSTSEWASTHFDETGAFAIFPHTSLPGINSDQEMVDAYGLFYNWYAVNDNRNICPVGWRIPADEDWSQMISFLMNEYNLPNHFTDINGVGNKLKAPRQVDHPWGGEHNTIMHPRWNSSGIHFGTDDFKFAAIPGGGRHYDGSYNTPGTTSYFWSKTEDSQYLSWIYHMFYSNGGISNSKANKKEGFSVRCIRNINTQNLTIIVSPSGVGTTTGAGDYEEGTEINITAIANEGYEFMNWTGDTNYIADANAPNTTVTMPAYDISITANFEQVDIIYGDGVTDIEGNEYTTVIIGEQEWMAENLLVSKYTNGDAIPTGLSNSEWENTTDGAFAIYPYSDNEGLGSDAEVVEAYGRLYNWYAVDDVRNLCPSGWRVPSDEDWTVLVDYTTEQGYPNESDNVNSVGNALKSCLQVNHPDGGECDTSVHPRWDSQDIHSGIDEFSFSALPGGYRGINGGYSGLGHDCRWWSSSEYTTAFAWSRTLTTDYGNVNRSHSNKEYGFSVRCVRANDSSTTQSLILNTNPAMAGSTTGAGEYESGIEVNITATANEGYEFVNWTGDTAHITNTNAVITTVSMPEYDISLTASFAEVDDGNVVTDIDGNRYHFIEIDSVMWMRSNLRTTKYQNGEDIIGNLSTSEWASTHFDETGAFAIFPHASLPGINSDQEMVDAYGLFYNWYAVNDNRNICPIGWRIPADEDWSQMISFLMNEYSLPNHFSDINGVGNKLKAARQVDHPWGGEHNTIMHPRWNSSGIHFGTDDFKFSAMPGGGRHYDGSYNTPGTTSYFWSKTEDSQYLAWSYYMFYSNGGISNSKVNKKEGFSVRCIRNINTKNLTIIVSPSGVGTTTGAGDYEEGTEINITAIANEGYEFVNWTGDTDSIADASAANTTLAMPAYDISLTANFKQIGLIYGEGVTDIEGNEYTTIIIGEQEWMAENLKTTKFSNGTDISYPGSDTNAWENNTNSAYASYDNDNINKETYGALYNWHAVNDNNGLCPEGWMVPSDNDWTELTNYMMAEHGIPNSDVVNGAGNALKSCRQVFSPLSGVCDSSQHPRWNMNSTHYGTDEFGFSALPGGYRNTDGYFSWNGSYGFWWASDDYSDTEAWSRVIYHHQGDVYRSSPSKGFGRSVRCIRNTEIQDQTPKLINP